MEPLVELTTTELVKVSAVTFAKYEYPADYSRFPAEMLADRILQNIGPEEEHSRKDGGHTVGGWLMIADGQPFTDKFLATRFPKKGKTKEEFQVWFKEVSAFFENSKVVFCSQGQVVKQESQYYEWVAYIVAGRQAAYRQDLMKFFYEHRRSNPTPVLDKLRDAMYSPDGWQVQQAILKYLRSRKGSWSVNERLWSDYIPKSMEKVLDDDLHTLKVFKVDPNSKSRSFLGGPEWSSNQYWSYHFWKQTEGQDMLYNRMAHYGVYADGKKQASNWFKSIGQQDLIFDLKGRTKYPEVLKMKAMENF